MVTAWIGDFRLKQLEYLQSSEQSTLSDFSYYTEDTASLSWFRDIAIEYIPKMYLSNADVVIMLGFNDCVYSCIWESFNIESIAKEYCELINKQIEKYVDCSFYVCSVNPVNSDYPFAAYKDGGKIPQKDLTEKIEKFNKEIQKDLKATFIDSYTYLNETNFETRDGVHYTFNTCKALQGFIESNFIIKTASSSASSTFETFLNPCRDTKDKAPRETNNDGTANDSFAYWKKPLNKDDEIVNGTVLPNCTGYAWGRFYEIIGEEPKLPTSTDAGKWYTNTTDGYERGKEPRVGAVICWRVEGSYGHVGIVESCGKDENGETIIVTSESGYRTATTKYNPDNATDRPNANAHFWVATRRYSEEFDNWICFDKPDEVDVVIDVDTGKTEKRPYIFQGFIYCPQTTGVKKSEISLEDKSAPDMNINAQYIWQYFGSRGWTLEAVAGLLGNMQQESGFSPNVWEKPALGKNSYYTIHYGEYESPSKKKTDDTYEISQNAVDKITTAMGRTQDNLGYGLVQWTPYTKYTNWCEDPITNEKGKVLPFWDMDSQLYRIEYESTHGLQWGLASINENFSYLGSTYGGLTFSEFTQSKKDVRWLAGAFALYYERPKWSTPYYETIDGKTTYVDNRARLCEERGAFAQNWYNYLKTLHPIDSETGTTIDEEAMKVSKVSNFKIDKITASSATLSFVSRNATKGSFTIDNGNPLELKQLKDGLTTFSVGALRPNSTHAVRLDVEGDGDNKFSETIEFSTPQAYPEPVRRITLSQDLKIEIVKPNSFGYWEKNSKGYDIQLIVNGKCIDTVEETSIEGWLKGKSYTFDKYTNKKIDDVIQIGVTVWVKDDSGNKICDTDRYQSPMPKTSNTICLLSKPVKAYLNID